MDAISAMSGTDTNKFKAFIGTGDNLGLPDKLAFLASYGELFVAVLSEKGEDTSLLVQNLSDELADTHPLAFINRTAIKLKHIESDHILSYLARSFGLQVDAHRRAVNIKKLVELSANLTFQGKRPIIILDEADGLKDNVLKSVMVIAEKCGFGLLIFGSQKLAASRSFKTFNSRIYICQMGKMNESDLRSYIRRTQDETIKVSDTQIDNILRQSNGFPGRVDSLLEEIMETPKPRSHFPVMHLSVFAMLILLGVFFYDSGFYKGHERVEEAVAIKFNDGQKAALGDDDLNTALLSELGELKTSATPIAVSGMHTTPEAISLPITEKASKPTLGSTASAALMPEDNNLLLSDVNAELSQKNANIPKQALLPPPKVKQVPADSWILNAKPNDYTLQIMGSSSEDRVIEFIQAQTNGSQFTYFETVHRNLPWFVLTLGQYRDRDAALEAILLLPPELRAQQPWAKKITSIRDNLR